MGDKTGIEWTNATWNPVRGCSRISAGCGGANHQGGCYAEKIAARFSGPGQAYEGFAKRTPHGGTWTGKMALVENNLDQPLRWKKPRMIFVNSMSDLFHENLPDEAIDRVFAVMALAPQHTFQVLTKRADRMRAYLTARAGMGNASICRAINMIPNHLGNRHGALEMPLPNVWLGVSVENQEAADLRIPDLRQTPAAKRFISGEPLLGPVRLNHLLHCNGCPGCYTLDCGDPGLDWVIVGGESGTNSRPMHPDWARSLRDQCASARIPFFFKQWGEWTPGENVERHSGTVKTAEWFDGRWLFSEENLASDDGHIDDEPDLYQVGKKAAGSLLDGVEHKAFPA